MLRYIIAILSVALITSQVPKEINQSLGNFTIKVNSIGGKINVNFGAEEKFEYNIGSFVEKNFNGTAIDTTPNKTHSFSGFTSYNFDLSDFSDSVYQNLNVSTTELKATNFFKNANLSAKVFFFKQDGKINVGKDVLENVQKGSVSVSFSVSGWSFCKNTGNITIDEPVCNGADGKPYLNNVLDYSFDIKALKNGTLSNVRGGNFTYGDFSFAYFAPVYSLDGVTKDMVAGFPALLVNQDTNTYTLRFDKFTDSSKWDSLIVIRKQDVPPQPPQPQPPQPTPVPNNGTQNVGKYNIEILGRSGKVNIRYENDTKFTFEFGRIAEVLPNGTQLEKNGGNYTHTFDKFANLDYEVTNFIKTTYQNLECFSSHLILRNFLRNATLDAEFLIFNQTGEIKTGSIVQANNTQDLKENVTVGAVKLVVGIKNWSFCANTGNNLTDEAVCNFGNQTSTIKTELELDIILKNKNGTVANCNANRTQFETQICKFGDSSAKLNPNYLIDNSLPYRSMPKEYPKIDTYGNKNTITFRFQQFKSGLLWDPIFQAYVQPTPTPTPSPSPIPPKPSPSNPIPPEPTPKTDFYYDPNGGSINFIYNEEVNKTGNNFNITFNSLREVNENGNTVGKTSTNHYTDNLSSFVFDVTENENGVYKNLNASKTTLKANNFIGNSTLSYNYYWFGQDGEITVVDKKYPIKMDDFKFDIKIENWNFCNKTFNPSANSTLGNCPVISNNVTTYEVSSFLELNFTVLDTNKAEQKSDGLFMYGKSKFTLPSSYNIDGKIANMPTGYPKYSPTNNGGVYTLRFAPFNQYVLYDPIINVPQSSGGSGLIIAIVIILVLILVGGVLMYCKNSPNRKHSSTIEGTRFQDV